MTLSKKGGIILKKIIFKAVCVLSDLCLYGDGVKLLSIYGAPQQVKAVGSALLNFRGLEIPDEKIELLRTHANYRMKLFSMGYGKAHCLIWDEGIGRSWFFWLKPEDKIKAFQQALHNRKIPYTLEWLPQIENLLLDNNQIEKLHGWGAEGYDMTELDDNEACNLIVKNLRTFSFFPKEIEEKLCHQYQFANDLEKQDIVARIIIPGCKWSWYVMNMDPEDHDYLWGFVDGFELECGSFSLSELISSGAILDTTFKPAPATDVWDRLEKKETILCMR
jgi:hypothetical protein